MTATRPAGTCADVVLSRFPNLSADHVAHILWEHTPYPLVTDEPSLTQYLADLPDDPTQCCGEGASRRKTIFETWCDDCEITLESADPSELDAFQHAHDHRDVPTATPSSLASAGVGHAPGRRGLRDESGVPDPQLRRPRLVNP